MCVPQTEILANIWTPPPEERERNQEIKGTTKFASSHLELSSDGSSPSSGFYFSPTYVLHWWYRNKQATAQVGT